MASVLALIFLVSGLALLAAVAYLTFRVITHRALLGRLLKLAQDGIDPLQLPAAAWPILREGGIVRLDYSGWWFGQPVQEHFGSANSTAHPFAFKVIADGDINLDFQLHAGSHHGEARLFTENMSGVLRLLLETAVHRKMEALSAALSEQARLSLYMQHDLRNLAQWVTWLAADLGTESNDESLLAVARRLRTCAPHAAARARRIMDATGKSNLPNVIETFQLSEVIREAAEHAGLPVDIEFDAQVKMRRDLLDRTLDNLFSNVSVLLRENPELMIAVHISRCTEKVMITFKIPFQPDTIKTESLFEPFTSGRPGGLGLGLYQARKSMIEAGGNLAAIACGSNICFSLSLPAIANATPL